MPVQILPYVPSFLEQLAPHIKQAMSDVSASLEQRKAMKGLNALFNPLQAQAAPGQEMPEGAQMPQQSALDTTSPLAAVQAFKLAEKALGPAGAKVLVDSLMQKQKLGDKEASEIRKEERKAAAEQKKTIEEKREHQGNIQKTFNVASSLLAKNTPGVGVSPGAKTGLSRTAVEGRNFFNNLKGKFESILLPMVNKGTLAKERFNFILSQIPDASDPQRVIAGKLRGLAETLSEEGFPIDTKILDSIPWAASELKNLGKEEVAKPPLESFFK